MKKFRYRLESLLKVKEHIERERQKVHATAMGQVVSQENKLGDLDRQRIETVKHQIDSQSERIDVTRMLVYSRFFSRLKHDRTTGIEMLKALRQKAEKERLKLVEATREKKIYQKLKEKKEEQFQKDAKRLEEKETDETALQVFRRRSTPLSQ